MKTTTSTQDSNEGLTLTQYDARITVCEGRLEFSRTEGNILISREYAHKVLDHWFDCLREARNMSGQAKLL